MKAAVILLSISLALVLASPGLPLKRQATTINGDHFTSAAAHLISLYIPSSVASAIDSAAAAASVTGPPGSIIQSALLATATPAWFTGVPSQYIPNINALESQITALRDAQQSTNNAQRVVTTTDNHGNTFIEVLSATHATQTVVVVPTSTTTPVRRACESLGQSQDVH
ncbi:hypothetical protein LTR66_002724 [Elasticomyces elasticus]|nr:hypothetical protein LTR66_002724 [Elasticomyces elasticus]